MERNTNEEQRRSFAAVVRGATGRTAPSVRPAMDERAGASSSERNASEEARASQEAVAELNEYVRLMELGVPARLRPEPEGRAVVEVSGELIPVFARPSMHASEDAMDWEESVQPGNYSWQRPAWQQRTDADRRRDARQRRRANGVGTRQRTPSPGEGRRPNGGGEPLLEEDTRAMLEELVAARRPVEEWDGEAFEEVFRGSPEEEVLLLEEGEATATLRRSGETTEESARVPTPPLAPVQEPSALPLPPPVRQVSYVAGPHGLVFQPFAVQQQRLPQTEYPLDGQQQRQLRRPGPYQEQQQHRQLPRLQPQQHQREEVRVEVRPLGPVAGSSSLSGNTAAPTRIRGENFWRPGAGSTLPSLQSRMEEEPKELPFEESRSEEAAMESARRRKALEVERERPISGPVLGPKQQLTTDSKVSSYTWYRYSQSILGGAVVGLLCAILVVMFIVYRMRKKDEGSYALEEPRRSPATNSYPKVGVHANNREFYA
ncbi:unnamed protein product [Trichogramma brassicae]|uniref:Syndecan n=1 Tax=Trichogramma brassicae TaxID=86971 RepID=A0A6H5IH44_9HYME|nr:unnamed protein product [Trichogramma brassicae]